MVYFVEVNQKERYEYTILEFIRDNSDILIPLKYQNKNENIEKIFYMIFSESDFQIFYETWTQILQQQQQQKKIKFDKEKMILRVIIYDQKKQFPEDYQIIELLYMELKENIFIIYYRILGQLIERSIMEKILEITSKQKNIQYMLEFHEEKERKLLEYKKKIFNDTTNPFLEYDTKTNTYIYNKKKGLLYILNFEEDNIFSNDEFIFRKFDKEILETIVQIQFLPHDISLMKLYGDNIKKTL